MLALAQLPGVRTVQSTTGQFVVHGPPPQAGRGRLTPIEAFTNQVIRLNPDQLVVVCERLKSILLRELQFADFFWLSKIQVQILPYARPDQTINISSVLGSAGWVYQVDLPEQIAPERLIRGLTHVLLLELAQRQSAGRGAEIPLWLVEGLTRQLSIGYRHQLVLPHHTATSASMLRTDPLAPTRALLRSHKPLTFAQLSLPTAADLAPNAIENFQGCSQLLVVELLRRRNGTDAMARFLASLPENLNWQVAFQRAFQAHFRSLLDVEKWWALKLVDFTGRDPTLVWAPDQAPAKLDELLRVSTRAVAATNALPRLVHYSLQDVIQKTQYPEQSRLFRQKISQIAAAQINVPPSLQPMLLSYRSTLEQYLQARDRAGFAPPRRGQPYANPKTIAAEAVKKLDDLDLQRRALTASAPAADAATEPPAEPPQAPAGQPPQQP